jgi:hypothetical protein
MFISVQKERRIEKSVGKIIAIKVLSNVNFCSWNVWKMSLCVKDILLQWTYNWHLIDILFWHSWLTSGDHCYSPSESWGYFEEYIEIYCIQTVQMCFLPVILFSSQLRVVSVQYSLLNPCCTGSNDNCPIYGSFLPTRCWVSLWISLTGRTSLLAEYLIDPYSTGIVDFDITIKNVLYEYMKYLYASDLKKELTISKMFIQID